MPWDNTDLFVVDLKKKNKAGQFGAPAAASLPSPCSHALLRAKQHTESKKLSGGNESVCNLEWGKGDTLYFVTDKSNWWNIWAFKGGARELLTAVLRWSSE